MAVEDQPRLSRDVVALLDGNDLDGRVGFTIELLSVDADGWPRVALLSVGEVLAVDDSRVRLALWPESRTTANLERGGHGVLALVHDGGAYTLRLDSCRAPDLLGQETRAVFDSRITSVRRDEVSYARLQHGITFDLPDGPAVVGRWRSTIDALRVHPGCGRRREAEE